MSLLAALDFFYFDQSIDSVEVEYRLLSWGEIYPPFFGDREHSLSAQYILRNYPFKLFSVSIPYSETPQKLCLTFKAPILTFKTGNVSSTSPQMDQIAKEFAAFLSVVTRRRIFAMGSTREGGIPVDNSSEIYGRSHQQERQSLKEINPEIIYKLLKALQSLDREIGESFITAIRLYHSAIEMMYTEPDFAYLFLVMSLESISSAIYKNMSFDQYDDKDLNQYLNSTFPRWQEFCKNPSIDDSRIKLIKMLLGNKVYLTGRKLRKFVEENLPETFWIETNDDAKPEYIYGLIVPDISENRVIGKEVFHHSDKEIHEWEKIDRKKLKKTLDEIYKARSKFVHEGKRLPASIVVGHYKKLPFGAFDEILSSKNDGEDATKGLKLPPFITLERLVSYSLVNFLDKQTQI